jgi:MYXO-CTERM domain-containing protein
MKKLLYATAGLLALATVPANATLLTGFSQESLNNTVVATDNGTVTNISVAAGTLVTLGGGLFNVAGASFELSATSIDAAVNISGEIVQHYSGSFCVSSVSGCGGNFLSGTFTDAAFGAAGGPGLTVQVSNPPESLVLTSNVIPAGELLPPSSFNLTFVNFSAPLAIDGSTIGAFDASFTGDVSSNAVAASEPASLGILGLGLLGIGMVAHRRRSF